MHISFPSVSGYEFVANFAAVKMFFDGYCNTPWRDISIFSDGTFLFELNTLRVDLSFGGRKMCLQINEDNKTRNCRRLEDKGNIKYTPRAFIFNQDVKIISGHLVTI